MGILFWNWSPKANLLQSNIPITMSSTNPTGIGAHPELLNKSIVTRDMANWLVLTTSNANFVLHEQFQIAVTFFWRRVVTKFLQIRTQQVEICPKNTLLVKNDSVAKVK